MNTQTRLTPEQLPQTNAQFIAYGAATRIADPFGGDDPITIRPQVFVRYYRGIKIKAINKPAEDTLHIEFDPDSVGLSKAFSTYMNADDPAAAYVQDRFEAGAAVDVGLESVRRKKEKAGAKAEIPSYVPIHALRGATNADGSGDAPTMMGAGGNHIRNVLGLIDGLKTNSCTSDPTEWAILTTNRKGDLPPEGYRALLSRDDWKNVGAITPKAENAPTAQQARQDTDQQAPAAGIDPNVLAKIVQHAVRDALRAEDRAEDRAEVATHGNITAPPKGRVPSEPKQWVAWATKGVPNAGSYIVAGGGYVRRWAYEYLRDNTNPTPDHDVLMEASAELTTYAQDITDTVQARLYDGAVVAGRMDPSHKEMSLWVRFVIEQQHPFLTDADFNSDAWKESVTTAAVEFATAEMKAAAAHLESQQSAPRQQQGQRSETTESDQGHALHAFTQLLGSVWDDAQKLRQAAAAANQQGLMGVLVWANPGEGKFSTEQFEGARQFEVGVLTHRRYQMLTADQEQAAPVTPASPSTPSEPPHDEDEPPHEERQPQPAAPAPQPAAPVQQQSSGAFPSAQHLAVALAGATNEETVATLFQAASAQNYLTAEIAVKDGVGAFGIAPVAPNTAGARMMSLGATFDAVQERLSNPTAAAAATQDAAATSERAEAPAPEPSGNAGGAGRSAQDIANAAQGLVEVAELTALAQEASSAGVDGETVTIGTSSGTLAKFLESRIKRAQRRDAAGGA